MKLSTVNVQPYGRVNISGGESIAYINGNAPRIIIRMGSDAMNLPQGQCIPVDRDYAAIVNPYPRDIEVLIGRNMPVQFQPETSTFTQSQQMTIHSFTGAMKDAVPGKKFAQGFMAKKGTCFIQVVERMTDNNTRIMILPGASPDFMAFKPAGCMAETIPINFSDGEEDTSLYSVAGEYTDADVVAWMQAAKYGLAPIVLRHSNAHNAYAQYRCTTDTAVFYVREAGFAANYFLKLLNMGADLSEFD